MRRSRARRPRNGSRRHRRRRHPGCSSRRSSRPASPRRSYPGSTARRSRDAEFERHRGRSGRPGSPRRASPSRSASAAGTMVAPPASSAASADGPVAGRRTGVGRRPACRHRRRPPRRSGRRASATSNVAIGLIRAMPGDRRRAVGDTLVRRDRADRGHDQVARHDIGDPGPGRRAGVLPDPTERDDHRQPDRQRPERQCRPARIADDRARGPGAPRSGGAGANGDPGHPGDGRQDERDGQRADEQHRVDEQSPGRTGVRRPVAAGPARPSRRSRTRRPASAAGRAVPTAGRVAP